MCKRRTAKARRPEKRLCPAPGARDAGEITRLGGSSSNAGSQGRSRSGHPIFAAGSLRDTRALPLLPLRRTFRDAVKKARTERWLSLPVVGLPLIVLLAGAVYSLSHLPGADAQMENSDDVRIAIERLRATPVRGRCVSSPGSPGSLP